MLRAVELTAPSQWACFLMYGEQGDLSEAELDAILTWLEREGMYKLDDRLSHRYPVSCEEAGFMRWHDASREAPYASDCETYVFLLVEGE